MWTAVTGQTAEDRSSTSEWINEVKKLSKKQSCASQENKRARRKIVEYEMKNGALMDKTHVILPNLRSRTNVCGRTTLIVLRFETRSKVPGSF
jgi:hypothetical protein